MGPDTDAYVSMALVFVMGCVMGFVLGLGAAGNALNTSCEKGTTWRTLDYTYHCTAEKRP